MNIISFKGYLDFMSKGRKVYAQYLTPVCKKWKLTNNEMDVLLFFYNNPQYDRATDVVTRRGIAKSHVSLSVAGLEQKGLIQKSACAADRRTVRLKLTESGMRVAEEGRKAQHAFSEMLCSSLTTEELELWMDLTRKIWESMDKFNEIETD